MPRNKARIASALVVTGVGAAMLCLAASYWLIVSGHSLRQSVGDIQTTIPEGNSALRFREAGVRGERFPIQLLPPLDWAANGAERQLVVELASSSGAKYRRSQPVRRRDSYPEFALGVWRPNGVFMECLLDDAESTAFHGQIKLLDDNGRDVIVRELAFSVRGEPKIESIMPAIIDIEEVTGSIAEQTRVHLDRDGFLRISWPPDVQQGSYALGVRVSLRLDGREFCSAEMYRHLNASNAASPSVGMSEGWRELLQHVDAGGTRLECHIDSSVVMTLCDEEHERCWIGSVVLLDSAITIEAGR